MTAMDVKKISRRLRRRRIARRWAILMLLAAAIFLAVDRNFKPLVFSLAEARSAALATQVLRSAVSEALEGEATYDQLMNVRMDEKGQVALLSANTMRLNQLADKAGASAQRMLESMENERVSVPLGAALGITLFAGSGPRIPVSIVPIGSITTEFKTEFEANGINQTRHKIFLTVTANIRIVIPTGAKTTSVTVNMLAAESIIVGAVPEGFVGYNLSEAELDLVQ